MRSPEDPADDVVAAHPVTKSARRMDDKIRDLRLLSALGADGVRADCSAAPDVAIRAPDRSLQVVLVAPGDQRPERRPQSSALVSEDVLVTTAGSRASRQHVLGDQESESFAQDGFRDAQVSLEIAEPPDAVEGVTHDQQRPTLADDFEGSRDRAGLCCVFAGKRHGIQYRTLRVRSSNHTLARVRGSLIEPSNRQSRIEEHG